MKIVTILIGIPRVWRTDSKRSPAMKTMLVLSILFCVIAFPALGELTDADLDKIRLIVKEEVKAEITGVRQEITGVRQEIAGVRQELKAEITGVRQEIAAVKQELKAEIAGSEKRMKDYIDVSIEGVNKRFETYNWVIYILLPIIVATIGIPTAVIAWRVGTDRPLERRVETLVKEVEMLKQQRSA